MRKEYNIPVGVIGFDIAWNSSMKTNNKRKSAANRAISVLNEE
jgi:hypothetical protein